jgi:hypothetical protein
VKSAALVVFRHVRESMSRLEAQLLFDERPWHRAVV